MLLHNQMGRTPNNIRSYNRNLSKAREARAKARRDVVREAPGVAEVRGVLFQLIEMAIAESDERFEIDEEIENEEIEASFDDENSDIALAFYDTTQKIDSQDLTLKFLQWNPTAETKVRGNGLRIKVIDDFGVCLSLSWFYQS